MALSLVTQSKAHTLEKRGHDLYETPEVATRALIKYEPLPHRIWEPACGRGAIARVLCGAGHFVHATDLIDYGEVGTGGCDFFAYSEAPTGLECIVTNPPYKLATEFVAHGLKLCPLVIVLCRLAFIEGVKRQSIMTKCEMIYAFANRLPMMHRDGWEGPKSSSAMAFAWFVFNARHRGDITLRRISWGPV